MRSLKITLLGAAILLASSIALAIVPQIINYQGLLSDSGGNIVADGNYSITFKIYDAPDGSTLLWNSGPQSIAVTNGLFSIELGVAPMPALPDNLFTDTSRYLGITVGGDPQLTPLTRLTTAPYVYQALRADTAGYVAWTSVSNKPLVISDLLCSDGQVAMYSTASGAGEWICVENNDHSHAAGFSGWTDDGSVVRLSDPGDALGIGTASPETPVHVLMETDSASFTYGFTAELSNLGTGGGAAVNIEYNFGGAGGPSYGLTTNSTANSSDIAYGSYASANNIGSGAAIGGYFTTGQQGTSYKYGIESHAYNNNSAQARGVYGAATHFGTGSTYGGYFEAQNFGTGQKYGIYGRAEGNQGLVVYGVYGTATNLGAGNAIAVYGLAGSSGSGDHFGVMGLETAGGSGAAIYAAGDQIASGTKSAVLSTSQGEKLMYAVEATEVWFEHIGRDQLVNGSAHVELDPIFLETVEIDRNRPMQVFIQLNDDCNGTYVKTGQTGFDVYELQGGKNNANFSYRVMAKRRGYKSEYMRDTNVGKYDINVHPERRAEIEAYWKEVSNKVDVSKGDANGQE